MTDTINETETDTETTRRPKLPEPDLEQVELAVVGVDPSKRKKYGPRGPRERSKVQKAFDALIEATYKKWVEAGKPADLDECPMGRTVTPDSQIESVESYLRRSAAFLNVSLRFGVREVNRPGFTDVYFTVRDRKAKPATEE